MKETRDCNVVQDLLPNYIEGLTNIQTNQYIEEHTKECTECRKILDHMKKDLSVHNSKRNVKEVNYIKKYNSRMKTLKIVLLLILILFMIMTGRKFMIISNLQNRANEYVNSENYHKVVYSYEQDTYIKNDLFILHDKKMVIITKIVNGEKTVTKMYSHGDLANIYIENEDKKIAKLNQKLQMVINLSTPFYAENFWQLLIASIPTSITTKDCNGKECYYVTNYVGPYMFCQDGTYIEKETGLVLRTVATTENMTDGSKSIRPAIDYVYEFNTVTENDFIEPDINGYEVTQ